MGRRRFAVEVIPMVSSRLVVVTVPTERDPQHAAAAQAVHDAVRSALADGFEQVAFTLEGSRRTTVPAKGFLPAETVLAGMDDRGAFGWLREEVARRYSGSVIGPLAEVQVSATRR